MITLTCCMNIVFTFSLDTNLLDFRQVMYQTPIKAIHVLAKSMTEKNRIDRLLACSPFIA